MVWLSHDHSFHDGGYYSNYLYHVWYFKYITNELIPIHGPLFTHEILMF